MDRHTHADRARGTLLFLTPAYSQQRQLLRARFMITGDQGAYQLQAGSYRIISRNVPDLPPALGVANARQEVIH